MTPEVLGAADLDALVAALAAERRMVVVAPNGTVNTGLVTGDQRQIVSTSATAGPAARPMGQGPVRPKDLLAARRRFVPPPGFGDALAALDSGVSALVGAPGTGRETHALNLLAHGHDAPVLVQVDGAVDLARWVPGRHGVHGYLVMEPADPFALRPWDLSRLEAALTEAGARLLMVLADAPGMVTALRNHLGAPVLTHLPPDPRKVFDAHLADLCPDAADRVRTLRAMGAGLLDEVLHTGLPPRHAARAAQFVARPATEDGACATGVLRALARAEATELVAQAREDRVVLAHLISLSAYGGLDGDVVLERAAHLLEHLDPGRDQEPSARHPRQDLARQHPGPSRYGMLRALGAHFTQETGPVVTGAVSFCWPVVADAVWEILCRDHTDLLPVLHLWLADPGDAPDQVERAGQAVAALAVATAGRSLELLRPLALSDGPGAVEVAARCLGTTVGEPTAAAEAADLLDRWSVAGEAALRRTVAYACRPDFGRLTTHQVLRLTHRLVQRGSDDAEAAGPVADALVRHFAVGDSEARQALLTRLEEWAAADGLPGMLAALTFPAMAGTDLAWWSGRIGSDDATASSLVRLTGHALNESAAYPPMRDVLFAWSRAAERTPSLGPALEELLKCLTAARQPGFLRWLLAVERIPDALPVKVAAPRLLAALRTKPPAPPTD
ncbi:hypothetical protein ACIP68_26275 [Streptomyces griseoviridis]